MELIGTAGSAVAADIGCYLHPQVKAEGAAISPAQCCARPDDFHPVPE